MIFLDEKKSIRSAIKIKSFRQIELQERNTRKIIVSDHINGDDYSYIRKNHLNMTEVLLHLSGNVDDFSCRSDYEQETSAVNQILFEDLKKRNELEC